MEKGLVCSWASKKVEAWAELKAALLVLEWVDLWVETKVLTMVEMWALIEAAETVVLMADL